MSEAKPRAVIERIYEISAFLNGNGDAAQIACKKLRELASELAALAEEPPAKPSEIAEKVAREWLIEQVPNQRFYGDFRPDHIASLAQRIQAAIEEEREACTKLADALTEYPSHSLAAEAIAAAIRARGEAKET
jgi:hypothetical protein